MSKHIVGAGYSSGAYSPSRARKKARAHKKVLRKLRRNKGYA